MRHWLVGILLGISIPALWAVEAPVTTASEAAAARIAAGDQTDEEASMGPFNLGAGQYAVFHTSAGDFFAKLLEQEAPNTVKNFVDLSTGKKSWTHPITLLQSNQPIYNNTQIYKIAKDVWIHGGDPLNRGTGGPGYELDEEIVPDLSFTEPGLLAMDNSGKKSNGSLWFVSLSPFPDWTGRFTIFGKVIGGLDVVRAISRMPTRKPTIPLEPVLLSSIEIVEIPEGKKTTASFSMEGGHKVLTVDKNFADAPVAAPAPAEAPKAAEDEAKTSGTEKMEKETSAPLATQTKMSSDNPAQPPAPENNPSAPGRGPGRGGGGGRRRNGGGGNRLPPP